MSGPAESDIEAFMAITNAPREHAISFLKVGLFVVDYGENAGVSAEEALCRLCNWRGWLLQSNSIEICIMAS